MLEVGRLCVKTAGRDAMQYCVIVDTVDEKHVIIDGNTRRKKVNKLHLEPLNKTLDVKKGADTKTVLEVFEKADLPVRVRGEARSPKPQTPAKEAKTSDKKKTSAKK